MKKALFIVFAAAFLVSCDPPHSIIFSNTTAAEARVKIGINPETAVYFPPKRVTGDSIVLTINPDASEMLHFGIGTWSDTEVSKIAGSINILEIKAGERRTVYTSRDSIEAFLKENRKGALRGWQTKIEIEIE